MQTFLQDLRYAARTLSRASAYTVIAVLTLALGIGANTAIFSVIHAVLLKDLPFANGARVVRLKQPVGAGEIDDAGFSVQEVADLRTRSRSLQMIVEYHSMFFNLLRRGEPQRVQTGVVSANYFDALGVRPLFGRTFREGEDHGRCASRGAELPLLARTTRRRQHDHRQDRRDDGPSAYSHRHPAATAGIP